MLWIGKDKDKETAAEMSLEAKVLWSFLLLSHSRWLCVPPLQMGITRLAPLLTITSGTLADSTWLQAVAYFVRVAL